MIGRATPRNTASAQCRWRRMFTNVRGDMSFANLPNVRGNGVGLREERTALTPPRTGGCYLHYFPQKKRKDGGMRRPSARPGNRRSERASPESAIHQRLTTPASQAGEILLWKLFRKDQPGWSSNVRYGWKADASGRLPVSLSANQSCQSDKLGRCYFANAEPVREGSGRAAFMTVTSQSSALVASDAILAKMV